jgi:ATPase family protein associated with various cellular activities (AAA)/winged helix domain-containing protein
MTTVDAPVRVAWSDANQRVLVAEFERLKALLGGADSSAAAAAIEKARAELPAPAAIDHLVRQFPLSSFERDLLLLAAGVEMDGEIAVRCMRPGAARPAATFALALASLPDAHWSALTPTRPLRHWSLIEVEDGGALSTSPLRIDERVLHFLAGVNYLDPRLRPLFRIARTDGKPAPGHAGIAARLVAELERREPPAPRVQLIGSDASGQHDVAVLVAQGCGLRLHVVSADDLPANPYDLDCLLSRWERDAVLLESALLVECDDTPAAAARRFADVAGGLVLLSTRDPLTLRAPDVRARVDRPTQLERVDLWRGALGAVAADFNGEVEGVSAHYQLSARDITRAAAEVTREAPWSGALWAACRSLEAARMDGLAQRIEAGAGWEDLILPDSQKTLLRQIAAQVRLRLQVHERWGFGRRQSRGLGLSALFAGESGTGKTMAAEVLSRELSIELFRIDLSAVVSKYIGETEKNLARVFDSAERSGAILLFDEADALFGKRSEVRDSHDRYANIEVSYLLQRMEAYRGLAILTTNQKAALDPAFQRRLRFVVSFPFPAAAEREAIWRGVFPPEAPTRDLDFAKLARLNASGGQIRNIALTGAFFAADRGEAITMAHLLRAARADAAKRDRALTDAETRGWV